MNTKKKQYLLVVFIVFIVLCTQIGIILGVYYSVSSQNNDSVSKRINERMDNHRLLLNVDMSHFIYIVNIGDTFSRVIPYNNVTLEDFVNLYVIDKSPVKELHNEFKYVPKTSFDDRVNFEDLMKINIKSDYELMDFTTDGLIPSRNRTYYCPLTWIAPNTTVDLYPFLGVDLCNVTSWLGLIDKMNTNSALIFSNERFVFRTKEYAYDIGKSIMYENTNNIKGYSIVSFFPSPLMLDSLNNIYGEDNAHVQVFINNELGTQIYESPKFNNTSSKFSSEQTYQYIENDKVVLTWFIRYRYSSKFIDLLSNDTSTILLIVLILIFVVINIIIFVFYFMYINRRHKEKQNSLELENAYISGMVNYVNHEIRNPLNGVMGLLDITKMSLEEQKNNISDYDVLISNLDTAYKSGILIKHIVNDVLDVRRLEEGRLRLTPTHVDLKRFEFDFIKIIQRKVEENVHIEFSLNRTADYIYADKNRIMQICLNLVTNSFKFTNEGRIDLNIISKEDCVRFECVDTGCGIAESKKKDIFQKFIQLEMDSSNNTIYSRNGFGLGLYLCKLMIDLMDGRIGFESEEDLGSTFWFELPNKTVVNNDINKINELV